MRKSPRIFFFTPVNSGDESTCHDVISDLSKHVEYFSHDDVEYDLFRDLSVETGSSLDVIDSIVIIEDGETSAEQNIVDDVLSEITSIQNRSFDVLFIVHDESRLMREYSDMIEPVFFVNEHVLHRQLERVIKLRELECATYDSTVSQRLVYTIIEEIETVNSREKIERSAVTEIVNTIDECVFAWCGVIDNDKRMVVPRVYEGDKTSISPPELNLRQSDDEFSIPIKEPIRNSQPKIVSNVQYNTDIPTAWKDVAVNEGYESFAVLPLMYKEYHYGVIVLYFNHPHPFNQALITGLNMLSELISLSIYSMEVTYDVTEMEAEIDELEKRIGQFMSVLSHDLRNPLNAAQGYTDMYLKDNNEKHLQWVEKSHSRIEQLITDMLKLLKEGEPITNTKQTPVRDVAMEAWELTDTKNARINIDTDYVVNMNPSRCQRLFTILFNNAIEHGGEDVTVTIKTIEDEDVEGFYIADNGKGLPELSSRDVFHHGYSTDNNGTGLGLTIAKNIVQSHGWKIQTCESETGGARFNIIVNSEEKPFEPV